MSANNIFAHGFKELETRINPRGLSRRLGLKPD
jgi:hypothetical protein